MSPGLNFQCLRRVVEPGQQPLLLLVGRDVQHALDDVVPLGDELGLELVDRVVAALDLLGGGELADPGDQHVLVVGAVEDPDVPRLGQRPSDPPQEVVRALLLGRRLERGDPHALRVDQADRVPQRAALAGGVHALQHQQHAPASAGPALGEQPLLQVGQLGAQRRAAPPCRGLAAVEAGRRVGVDRGEVDRTGGRRRMLTGRLWRCRPRRSAEHGRHVERAPDVGVGVPSACGSSNQTPSVKPTLASTRSEPPLRWSGAAKYDVASGNRRARPQHPRPQHPGAEPAADQLRVADRVVDPDRLGSGQSTA